MTEGTGMGDITEVNPISPHAHSFVFACVHLRSRDGFKRLDPLKCFMAKSEPDENRVETTTLTLRLPQDLMELLRTRAETENRSLSNLINTYLEMIVSKSTFEAKQMLANGRSRRVR
jgi:predicted HicB family RNase H-like nuclease